jgi:hypothetical protein
MKPKDLPVQHPKKGQIKLGDLSKNEVCRYVLDLLRQNNMLTMQLNNTYGTYANHIASIDAL